MNDEEFHYTVASSYFDINNNGIKNRVVREYIFETIKWLDVH